METGVHGQLGALAARLAEVDPKLEPVNATTLPHQMVELLVLEVHLRHKHATHWLAQPRLVKYLCCWIVKLQSLTIQSTPSLMKQPNLDSE